MALSRRKLRRIGKWAGLALVLLVLGVDVASVWLAVRVRDPLGRAVGVGGGKVWTDWGRRGNSPSAYEFKTYVAHNMFTGPGNVDQPHWWFLVDLLSPGGQVMVPIWFIALSLALPTAHLWHRDRHDKGPGHCAKCGYDLTGLAPGSACPECGKTQPSQAQD